MTIRARWFLGTLRGLLGVLALLPSLSCLSATDARPSEIQLIGAWDYTAVQTGTMRENLTGQLRILSESGSSFQGRLDMVGTNEATGETRMLGGSVSGGMEGDVVDFDANVDISVRRHVGQIVGDVIAGTWVSAAANGSIVTGTFRAERDTP